MSCFYDELSDLTRYSNHCELFWKFFRCMCKQLHVSRIRGEVEYNLKYKLISSFINNVIPKISPWVEFKKKYTDALRHTGCLTRETDPLIFMKKIECFFREIPSNYVERNLNVGMTISECFTILFLFTYQNTRYNKTVIKLIPKILICINSDCSLKRAIKDSFEHYMPSRKQSEAVQSSDLELLIHKYAANIRGLVDIENDIIRAGIYNDLCKTFKVDDSLKKISQDSYEETIRSLIDEDLSEDDLVEYFQTRIYNPCDAEIGDGKDNFSVVENVLFHSPVYKRNKHTRFTEGTYDVYANILPLSFAIFQAYNVNELYDVEKIKDSFEYKHFFRNTFGIDA